MFSRKDPDLTVNEFFCEMLLTVFRIHVFFGLPDPEPDPLVRGMDPDPDPALSPDPDPSIIKQI